MAHDKAWSQINAGEAFSKWRDLKTSQLEGATRVKLFPFCPIPVYFLTSHDCCHRSHTILSCPDPILFTPNPVQSDSFMFTMAQLLPKQVSSLCERDETKATWGGDRDRGWRETYLDDYISYILRSPAISEGSRSRHHSGIALLSYIVCKPTGGNKLTLVVFLTTTALREQNQFWTGALNMFQRIVFVKGPGLEEYRKVWAGISRK